MQTFDRKEFWRDPSQASDEVKEINGGTLYQYSQVDFYYKSTWGIRIAMSYLPKYCAKDWTILEFGCNTGHTLVELKKAGFTDLHGIEINYKAIVKGREMFPELEGVEMSCAAIEDVVKDLRVVDAVYGTGVFMHIPYDYDWIFEEIANKTRHVILTSENEYDTDGYYKWARNYKDIYEKFGWKQVEQTTGLDFKPLPATTIIRVFTHG